jgi:hypothetical protein
MNTARENGRLRTGRAALVRTHLATQTSPQTSRQIMDAIERKGNINTMCATLSTMYANGGLQKHVQLGECVRWSLPAEPKPAKQTSRPKAKVQPLQRSSKPACATLQAKKTKPNRQPRSPKEQKANFVAPISYQKSMRQQGQKTHGESVEDFVRRGGRIEVLPMGACSEPLQYDHSRIAEQRAKGRATQQKNRRAR